MPVSAGQPLPAGGGDAGKAFTALLAAAQKKNWAGVTAVTTPSMQKMLGADYNTPAENGAYALDMIKAWVPMAKTKVGAGELRGDTAILDVEGATKALNTELMLRIQETGFAVPTDTTVHGRYSLRVAFNHHRTIQSDIDLFVAEVLRVGEVLEKSPAAP